MQPTVIQDKNSGATAKIHHELGFNCFSFQAPAGDGLVEVLDAEPDFATQGGRASGNGIPILFPFPNRIRGGSFQWAGRDYQISGLDAVGNAIHGFVLDRPWRVIDSGQSFVEGEFQLSQDAADRLESWPADFIIRVRYDVKGAALACRFHIENPSAEPLPWGLGTHPYFRMPLSEESELSHCLIQAPASERWNLIDCLPTGEKSPVEGPTDLNDGQRLGETRLDDVLTSISHENNHIESIAMDSQRGLQIRQTTDPVFRELVVYTPPHDRSVCLEPYTCVTDAINLDQSGRESGWRTLPPGETFQTWINIELGPVYA